MKCKNCNYVCKKDWIDGALKIIEGDEEFDIIGLDGHRFTITRKDYNNEDMKIDIIACPKCKVLFWDEYHNF